MNARGNHNSSTPLLEPLTRREQEILDLLAEGPDQHRNGRPPDPGGQLGALVRPADLRQAGRQRQKPGHHPRQPIGTAALSPCSFHYHPGTWFACAHPSAQPAHSADFLHRAAAPGHSGEGTAPSARAGYPHRLGWRGQDAPVSLQVAAEVGGAVCGWSLAGGAGPVADPTLVTQAVVSVLGSETRRAASLSIRFYWTTCTTNRPYWCWTTASI